VVEKMVLPRLKIQEQYANLFAHSLRWQHVIVATRPKSLQNNGIRKIANVPGKIGGRTAISSITEGKFGKDGLHGLAE
jgi:hypothetical protein